MQQKYLKMVADAVNLVDAGHSVKDACIKAKISTSTYYRFKDKVEFLPKTKSERKTKAETKAPRLETIVTPHTQSKLAIVVGDAESILNILKGLN